MFTDGSRFLRNSLAEEEAYPTEREQPGLRGIPCSRLLYIPLRFLPVSIITSLFYHSRLFTFFSLFPVTPLQSQFFILFVSYVPTFYLASPWRRHFLHFVLFLFFVATSWPVLPFTVFFLQAWRIVNSVCGNIPGGILEIGWHEHVNSSSVNEVTWKNQKYIWRQSSGGHPQYRALWQRWRNKTGNIHVTNSVASSRNFHTPSATLTLRRHHMKSVLRWFNVADLRRTRWQRSGRNYMMTSLTFWLRNYFFYLSTPCI